MVLDFLILLYGSYRQKRPLLLGRTIFSPLCALKHSSLDQSKLLSYKAEVDNTLEDP